MRNIHVKLHVRKRREATVQSLVENLHALKMTNTCNNWYLNDADKTAWNENVRKDKFRLLVQARKIA